MCDSVKFVLLKVLIRRLTKVPVRTCLRDRFCRPLKLRHANCLPLHHLTGSRIIPSGGSHFLQGSALRKFIRSRTSTFFNKLTNGTKLFSATHRMTHMCRVLLGKKRVSNQHCLDGRAYRLFAASISGVDQQKLKFSGPSERSSGGKGYTPSTPTRICNRAKFANAYT